MGVWDTDARGEPEKVGTSELEGHGETDPSELGEFDRLDEKVSIELLDCDKLSVVV